MCVTVVHREKPFSSNTATITLGWILKRSKKHQTIGVTKSPLAQTAAMSLIYAIFKCKDTNCVLQIYVLFLTAILTVLIRLTVCESKNMTCLIICQKKGLKKAVTSTHLIESSTFIDKSTNFGSGSWLPQAKSMFWSSNISTTMSSFISCLH